MQKTMKQPALILLGLATLWPLVYLIIFLIKAAGLVVRVLDSPSFDPSVIPQEFASLIVMGVITTLLSIALMVIYILHVNKNESIDENARFMWTLLFILLGAVTMPVYYVLHAHPWAQDEPGETP